MDDKLRILLCEDDENLGMLLREYLHEKSKDYHRRKHYQMKEQGQKAIHLETTETTLFCFHIL